MVVACQVSWHGGLARSAHVTHEGRSHGGPSDVPGASGQQGLAGWLPALRVERRPPASAIPLRDGGGHQGPRLQPPHGGSPADRAAPRLGGGVSHLRTRVRAPRGHQDRPRLRLRPRRDRAPVPAPGRGHEPQRGEPRAARVIFRSAAGGTSRQANLAVTYLDAFAPAVLATLHPTDWPRVVLIDARSLFTRGYRRSPNEEGADERWVAELKAGTVLVALDGSARRPTPCLMRIAGGTDAESWKQFFATLEGAPEVVVADLDPAIGRAVRETWPHAILLPSRHHLAALMRERALTDGIPERIRLETPLLLIRPLPGSASGPSAGVLIPFTTPCWAHSAVRPSGRPSVRSWSATCRPTGWRCAAGWPPTSRSSGAPGRSPHEIPRCHARRERWRVPWVSGWPRSPDEPDAGRTRGGSTCCSA
jgi:hypothetical protein